MSEVETIDRILEKLRFASTQVISESMLRESNFDLVKHMVFGSVVARLEKLVLADNLGSESLDVEFHFPASWWDQFKQRYWRVFHDLGLVRFRIVKRPRNFAYVRTVNVKSFALFPEPKISYPDELGNLVRFQQVDMSSMRQVQSLADGVSQTSQSDSPPSPESQSKETDSARPNGKLL